MGILNVTPDSFSDGGRFAIPERAIDQALAMVEAGADIVDIGGESTRPGAAAVPPDEELARVLPVIEQLAARSEVTLSIDTMKARVAECALAAGAHIINDVSALSHDPAMVDVARASGAGCVLMHMQGMPRTMQDNPVYDDVVADVAAALRARVDDVTARGLARDTLAVDPGIGFGKTVEHNLQLLANLDALAGLGLPVVVGLSRKSFLGKLTGRDVDDRLAGSVAALTFCVLHGAQVMRVHDVKESCDAAQLAVKLLQHRGTSR